MISSKHGIVSTGREKLPLSHYIKQEEVFSSKIQSWKDWFTFKGSQVHKKDKKIPNLLTYLFRSF